MEKRSRNWPKATRFHADVIEGEQRRAFSFLDINQRQEKPRCFGLTEIRGPYYSPMGKHYLEDILETMGEYVDSLKFAGGSRRTLEDIINTAHRFNVQVSTGGFIERILTKSAKLVDRYISECAEAGFDVIEISAGFITLPIADWVALIKRVEKAGLKAKPEVGIQFGAGGASEASAHEAVGTASPQLAIEHAKRFLDAGVQVIMIVQLECLRRGIWGTSDLWGRVVTFKEG